VVVLEIVEQMLNPYAIKSQGLFSQLLEKLLGEGGGGRGSRRCRGLGLAKGLIDGGAIGWGRDGFACGLSGG